MVIYFLIFVRLGEKFNVGVVTQIVNMSDALLGQLPLQKAH